MNVTIEIVSDVTNTPLEHIKKYLQRSEAWQAAWDGEHLVWDLLPIRTRRKAFPEVKSMDGKREAVRSVIIEREHKALEVSQVKSVKKLADFLKINQKEIEIVVNNGIKLAKARKYARLAAWLRLLRSSDVKKLYDNKKEAWAGGLEAMNAEMVDGLLPLPHFRNTQTLMKKGKKYAKDGVLALVDGRKGLKNRERFEEGWKAFVFNLYKQSEPKLLIPEIYDRYCQAVPQYLETIMLGVMPRIYNTDKVENGLRWHYKNPHYCNIQYIDLETGEPVEIEPVCFEVVRSYLRSDKVERYATESRHGRKHNMDKHSRYITTKKSPYSLSIVSADDYWLNFWLTIDQKRTTQRPVVYIIWDELTGMPIGFSVGARQTKEMVMEAILDMLLFTGGRVPFEIELDNFGRKKSGPDRDRTANGAPGMEDYLHMIFQHVSYRKEARSKVAERNNYLDQEAYWRGKEGYLGGNVQDKKQDSKRNPDLAEYPEITYAMVKAEFAKYRTWKGNQRFGNSKMSNLEKFRASIHPEAATLGKVQLAQLFGGSHLRTIRHGQLEVDTHGHHVEYWVDIDGLYDNPIAAKYISQKQQVRVRTMPVGPNQERPSEQHFNRAFLFGVVNPDNPLEDVFLGELERKPEIYRAKVAQGMQDKEAMARHFGQVNRDKQQKEEYVEKQERIAATHFDESVISNSWLASRWLADEDVTSKDVQEKAQEQVDNSRLGTRYDQPENEDEQTEQPSPNWLGKRWA